MGRLGLLADIHGNALALEAVLADARGAGVREFVDLGDVLYGPLEPRRTYEILQTVRLVARVAGNQDRAIFAATAEARAANGTLEWVCRELPEEAVAWLRGAAPTAEIDIGRQIGNENDGRGMGLFACHGSPSSDTEYLLEEVRSGRAELRPEAEIAARLAGLAQPVVLCGHTHVARKVRLQTEGPQWVVNPGSVGLPAYSDDAPVPHVMESGSPHARWAILEWRVDESGAAGSWRVEQREVEYDWKAAAAQARRLGREDWAVGLERGRMDA